MKTSKIYTAALILALVFVQVITTIAQSVGINDDGSEPDSRAILDVKSNNKGVILPRLTDTERDALYRDVPFGMMIFNTTDSALQIFMDTAWYALSVGAFEIAPELTVTDIDGNEYSTVKIGEQVWMGKNLKTTTYNDGTPIELAENDTDWENNTTGAYCWFDNDEVSNAEKYGALYNWYAVNTGNLCPDGWHVPTDAEWKTLEMSLGMSQSEADNTGYRGTNEGSKLAGNAGLWNDGPLESDAEFGITKFIALPGGSRAYNGTFDFDGSIGYWWTSTENGSIYGWYRGIDKTSIKVYRHYYDIERGASVRCLKN